MAGEDDNGNVCNAMLTIARMCFGKVGNVCDGDGVDVNWKRGGSGEVENHLPYAPAFCVHLQGLKLAGAVIFPEPAIVTARRTSCRAASYGR